MPVDPNNPWVEEAHPKTVGDAREGWRYSCHNKPRPKDGVSISVVKKGLDEHGHVIFERQATQWLPGGCKHDGKATDPACEGCKWKKENL